MGVNRRLLPLLAVTGLTLGASISDCSADTFAQSLPSHARLESVAHVAQNGSYGEGRSNVAYPDIPTALPELCAVVVNVTSSPSSSFRFALFLPTEWNARFLEVGNGGFAGGINWMDMAVGARYGFACASTDTGHNSTTADGAWALNQPERIADWGWRAIHGTAVLAKSLTAAYYNSQAAYSYYSGCSTGGRQGLREAQLHPETFDGLLVGAPAWWTSHLQTWTTWIGALNAQDSQDHERIDPSLFPVIASEIMKQCDAADGVEDGIISAPDECKLNYRALECRAGHNSSSSSACLTRAQLSTLHSIYSPYVVAHGQLAMPGLNKGSEAEWPVVLGGTEPNGLGTGYERYFLFHDPAWDWRDYNDSIVRLADSLDPGRATAHGFANMSAVRDRGAKILMYHGMADGLIPTGSSEHFYRQVAAATSKRGGLVPPLKDWFRFFFVPGMGHCAGSAVGAPWYFAGPNQAPRLGTDAHSLPPAYRDRAHDALLALMAWVESGTAVESIVATSWKSPSDPASGVARQRPLCPYPLKARLRKGGDPDQAASWSCR
ncbi:feruloyl esterase-like protein B [Chaetomium strumarium]|uniref:Carboxylic ester hydrolase n=1 Tax=Chaetomium strumarium TaxID=1170767 RepID=A0AAJ0GPM4_9PEZI|nr:feruloyl esterase-like protein B [Chaetomium strumarium]